VALNPDGIGTLDSYARCLIYVGRPEEAIPVFKKAIRISPFSQESHYNLGMALRMTGRFEEAVSAYKKAIQLEPNNIIPHIQLAATYSLIGREKEAHAEAAEVLRINPKFSLDNYAKTVTFKDQSETDKFVNAIRKVGLK
jgi:adenylate cyclase